MKKLVKLITASLLAVSLAGCSSTNEAANNESSEKEVVRIAIAQYAQHPALDKAHDGFIAALNENGYVEGENLELSDSNAGGDSSNVETIANTIVNGGYDLAYAIATPMAQALATKSKELPIVISAVTDPASAGLVESNEKPNTNVTGASDLTNVVDNIELLTKLVPDAKKVGVMYCNSEDNSRVTALQLVQGLEDAGLEAVEYTVADSSQVQSVTLQAAQNVDAIIIGTDNLLAENMALVAQIATQEGVPTIVGEPSMCENGGLATMGIDYYALGFQAGLMAVQILQGADPATMEIYVTPSEDLDLCINQATLESLGLEVSEETLSDATIY